MLPKQSMDILYLLLLVRCRCLGYLAALGACKYHTVLVETEYRILFFLKEFFVRSND